MLSRVDVPFAALMCTVLWLVVVGVACSRSDDKVEESREEARGTATAVDQSDKPHSVTGGEAVEPLEPFVSKLYPGMEGPKIIELIRELSDGPGAGDEMGTVHCRIPRGNERRLYAFITRPTHELAEIRDRVGNVLKNEIDRDYLVAVVRVAVDFDSRNTQAYFPGIYIFPPSVRGQAFTGMAGTVD